MITDEQIENAAKVGAYKPSERAAYEHGLKWGMKRSGATARLTAQTIDPDLDERRAGARAALEGIADALEGLGS